jgi:hypothetical protein
MVMLASAGLAACGGDPAGGNCPEVTVVLDAVVDGLPDVGGLCPPALCEELCGGITRDCTRVQELVVTCNPSCL